MISHKKEIILLKIYDNYLIAEKLNRLQFLVNNFSIKALDKYNKKINIGNIGNINNLEENENNYTLRSKPGNSEKKQDVVLIKKKKGKLNKNPTTNLNLINENSTNKINSTNNNSVTISKSQNKLLNSQSI